MPHSIRPGDVLAGRYLLVDLLSESGNGRFWRAHDRTLDRHVAVHVIAASDDRAESMMAAARRSATVLDRRILRVLDVDARDDVAYVVNEWGSGTSLDILVAREGPVGSRRAAWIVSEVAASISSAHDAGVAHGRLVPENVLIDVSGSVRVIGFSVDAALLGLPPGRLSTDVTDLAALLYFLLTGRWPGVSRSAVPKAPQDNGRVLRPRQVRAGVPRPLDTLCDQVINLHGAGGDSHLDTAHAICEELRDFVGDASGMAAAEAAAGRKNGIAPGADTRFLPLVPGPAAAPVAPASAPPAPDPAPEPEPEPEPEPPAAPPAEQPTQAGLPIFDDETDDVSWLTARAETPPPPPPFEEPPERPLFAPDPADGSPVRRPRPGAASGANPEYWPWDASTGTGSPVSTGSGVIPLPDDEDEDDGVPGRSWLRLAAVLGASTLLLVAIIVAFNLGRGRSPLGDLPEEDQAATTPATQPSTSATPLANLVAADFDPQGDPPEENPELAPLVVDGDPATTWRTQTYEQNFGPGGLKSGAGLTIDLQGRQQVSSVDLTLVGAPTGVTLYLADSEPSGIQGLKPVASEQVETETTRITLDKPATGRFLVVWLTSIPPVEGGFRGEVAEVVVRG